MVLQQPTSFDECVYFTRRSIGKEGKVVARVNKEVCKQCGKSMMGKPKDPKTGKAKIRAKEYVCPACQFTIPEQQYEDTLTFSAIYTCPYCGKSGEAQVPYKRKKVKVFDEETLKEKTADAVQFLCQHCEGKINVTKKMK